MGFTKNRRGMDVFPSAKSIKGVYKTIKNRPKSIQSLASSMFCYAFLVLVFILYITAGAFVSILL